MPSFNERNHGIINCQAKTTGLKGCPSTSTYGILIGNKSKDTPAFS